MASGAKSAITIVVVLGVFVVLCGGGGFLLFLKFRGGGLSSNTVSIIMHDERSLAATHYVSPQLECRIRLPDGPVDVKINQTHDVMSEGDFIAGQTGRSIVVSRADRGSMSFARWVGKNRNGIRTTPGLSNVQFIEEGHCQIGGHDAYEITISCVIMGNQVRQRLIVVDSGSSKVYILVSTSLDDAWVQNFPILDSSLSTFEIGSFAPDPPQLNRGQPPNFGGMPQPQPQPFDPPRPPQPQPPMPHVTFTAADDALKYLQTGRPEERRAALSYLEQCAPDPALHDRVFPQLLRLTDDMTMRGSVLSALKNWATKADDPALRGELQRRVSSDPSNRNGETIEERRFLIHQLAADGDLDSIKPIAQSLRNPSLRGDAEDALTALGQPAEPALDDLLTATDADAAREAMKLLGSLGTQKSIMPLQRLSYDKDAGLANEATVAIKQIAGRLKLKPDDIQNNLINLYVIDAPAGFTADPTTVPNTRQWSHAGSGRAVRSVLQVTVKPLPRPYLPPNIPPNTNTFSAGSIEFHQVDATSTALTNTVHFTGVDGEYLIELTATMDKADTSAGTIMTNAVKKMHAVTP